MLKTSRPFGVEVSTLSCRLTKMNAEGIEFGEGVQELAKGTADEQLAYRLDVTAATIEAWRKRLEAYGGHCQ
jgi:hypothetical protein